MDWIGSITTAIESMEAHLMEADCVAQACRAAAVAPFYLQQGFRMMTNMTMTEYVRNRRLYQAALDLTAFEGSRVVDVALKWGYDTPESFSKAFSRFHGATPAQVKRDTSLIRVFQPLRVNISIQGGVNMDYRIEHMDQWMLAGFAKEIAYQSSYVDVPAFWLEYLEKYGMHRSGTPKNDLEQFVRDCHVGEFGACIDQHPEKGTFTYLIGGVYQGGPLPEGLTTFTFPAMAWAKFPCRGPLPGALQSVNTKVFKEWLPGNTQWSIAMGANIEWYGPGDSQQPDYESAIWVPVEKCGG